MRCEEMTERIPEWLAGELDEPRLAELRAHLAACAGCAEEATALERLWRELGEAPAATPDRAARMRARFDARLAREIAEARGGRVVRFEPRERADRSGRPTLGGFSGALGGSSLLRFAAAAALVAAGVFVGAEVSGNRSERQAAELRAEMRSLHETVALALLAERSPSERLKGVAYGRELSGEDPSVSGALFRAMLEDPNVNVRLAALDALRPTADRPETRTRLVAAVAEQDSPLVQLSLIDLLLESGGPLAEKTLKDLQQLLDNPDLDPVVRGYLRDRLGRSA
jgi:hypothetical protein